MLQTKHQSPSDIALAVVTKSSNPFVNKGSVSNLVSNSLTNNSSHNSSFTELIPSTTF